MVFTSLIWYIIELANVTKTIILEIEDQFFSIVLFHIIIMFHNSFYKNKNIIFSIILSTSVTPKERVLDYTAHLLPARPQTSIFLLIFYSTLKTSDHDSSH